MAAKAGFNNRRKAAFNPLGLRAIGELPCDCCGGCRDVRRCLENIPIEMVTNGWIFGAYFQSLRFSLWADPWERSQNRNVTVANGAGNAGEIFNGTWLFAPRPDHQDPLRTLIATTSATPNHRESGFNALPSYHQIFLTLSIECGAPDLAAGFPYPQFWFVLRSFTGVPGMASVDPETTPFPQGLPEDYWRPEQENPGAGGFGKSCPGGAPGGSSIVTLARSAPIDIPPDFDLKAIGSIPLVSLVDDLFEPVESPPFNRYHYYHRYRGHRECNYMGTGPWNPEMADSIQPGGDPREVAGVGAAGGVSVLRLLHHTCQHIPRCPVCEPEPNADEGVLISKEVKVDFTATPDASCLKQFKAIVPECLGPVEVFWSFGKKGAVVSHHVDTLSTEVVENGIEFKAGDTAEVVTMWVVDGRGCIYIERKVVICGCACLACTEAKTQPNETLDCDPTVYGVSGGVTITELGCTDVVCQYLITANVSASAGCQQLGPFVSVCVGTTRAECMYQDCLPPEERDPTCEGCVKLASGQTYTVTVDKDTQISWAAWDRECGCSGKSHSATLPGPRPCKCCGDRIAGIYASVSGVKSEIVQLPGGGVGPACPECVGRHNGAFFLPSAGGNPCTGSLDDPGIQCSPPYNGTRVFAGAYYYEIICPATGGPEGEATLRVHTQGGIYKKTVSIPAGQGGVFCMNSFAGPLEKEVEFGAFPCDWSQAQVSVSFGGG